jgi:hypothetical protein
VLSELLVEEASAYVLGQAEADLQLNQAVRNAVVKRLEWLDSNFLAALNAFLSVPGVRGDPQLSELLSAIRQETLQLVRTWGKGSKGSRVLLVSLLQPCWCRWD